MKLASSRLCTGGLPVAGKDHMPALLRDHDDYAGFRGIRQGFL